VVRLPRSAVSSHGSVTGMNLRWRLITAILITACLAVLSLWPALKDNPVIGVINLLVAVSFMATGVILGEEPAQRSTARSLKLTAIFYLMSWWWNWPANWEIGPLPLLSFLFGYLWFVFGGLALLRYPEPTLSRSFERAYILILAGWICLAKLLLAVVSLPEWAGYNRRAWWPSLLPNRSMFTDGTTAANFGLVALAIVMVVLLFLKVRRAAQIDRIDAVPVVVAAYLVCICGGVYLMARLMAFPDALIDTLRAVIGIAALFTPLAFLTTALRRQLARSSVADLILRLAASPSLDGVQNELRRSLQDPTLVVWFWLPSDGVYANVDNEAAAAPPADGRWLVTVQTSTGESLAALVIDRALERHPSLVGPAVAACGFALENGRLQADIRAQLAEVQASRARIVQAGLAERRRIERDLHDGAQQSLLAATASLGAARVKAALHSDVTEAIDRARSNLHTALTELRQLAHGIHPALLSQSGLASAIEDIAERLKLPTRLNIINDRLPAPVETTIYFVACEALTNIAKYASATSVTVIIDRFESKVRVQIDDNGVGGATASPGSGLAGIVDRVNALGGTMHIDSPTSGGTRVSASVPCV
jgi:signal transduction histidine kinase